MNMKAIVSLVIATLGNFSVGYDIAIMSGAILFLDSAFQLSVLEQGALVSTTLFGALIGCLASALLSARLSLKGSLHFSGWFFLVGFSLLSFAQNPWMLFTGKLLNGIGTGISCSTAPLYVAEITPRTRRGFFLSFPQISNGFGIIAGYLVFWFLSDSGNWSRMFMWGLLPAFLLLWIPTPHTKEFDEPTQDLLSEKKISSLKPKSHTHLLIIGLILAALQQTCGISAVLGYMPVIFESILGDAEGPNPSSFLFFAPLLVSVINIFIIIPATLYSDKIGRKRLLINGLISLSFSLPLLAISLHYDWAVMAVVATILSVGSFSASYSPLLGVILTELFPKVMAQRAMSLCILCCNLFNFLVTFTYLPLANKVTESGAFLIYTAFTLLALFFVYRFVPETKASS